VLLREYTICFTVTTIVRLRYVNVCCTSISIFVNYVTSRSSVTVTIFHVVHNKGITASFIKLMVACAPAVPQPFTLPHHNLSSLTHGSLCWVWLWTEFFRQSASRSCLCELFVCTFEAQKHRLSLTGPSRDLDLAAPWIGRGATPSLRPTTVHSVCRHRRIFRDITSVKLK